MPEIHPRGLWFYKINHTPYLQKKKIMYIYSYLWHTQLSRISWPQATSFPAKNPPSELCSVPGKLLYSLWNWQCHTWCNNDEHANKSLQSCIFPYLKNWCQKGDWSCNFLFRHSILDKTLRRGKVNIQIPQDPLSLSTNPPWGLHIGKWIPEVIRPAVCIHEALNVRKFIDLHFR